MNKFEIIFVVSQYYYDPMGIFRIYPFTTKTYNEGSNLEYSEAIKNAKLLLSHLTKDDDHNTTVKQKKLSIIAKDKQLFATLQCEFYFMSISINKMPPVIEEAPIKPIDKESYELPISMRFTVDAEGNLIHFINGKKITGLFCYDQFKQLDAMFENGFLHEIYPSFEHHGHPN